MTTTFRGGEIMGIRIPTVFSENNARRCEGCGEPIAGRPFRVSILGIVSTEVAPSWAGGGARINPGPHEFHPDPEHVRAWCRAHGFLVCRLSSVREIMRPVALPGDGIGEEAGEGERWGLCDGLHREAHEFIPA
jgi:hypothetical protein